MAYTRDQLIALVQDYANGAGIDPAIAVAQIQRESRFNPNANGTSGEKGLAQFMPGTWARFGYGSFENAYDPDYALTAWAEYMKYLLNLFNWDYWKALVGYNGGEGHLLNPGKYGAPSSAAKTYATEIQAAAGQPSSGQPARLTPDWADYCDPDGFCYGNAWNGQPKPSGLSITTLAIVAGIGLIAIFLLTDD